MMSSRQTLGGLDCRLIGPVADEDPKLVVVLCHGFGASGEDLVPLAKELVSMGPESLGRVLYVFPEAPLTVPEVPGGRAWWPLDMAALQRAAQQGEVRDMRRVSPPELPAAREKLLAAIDELRESTGLPLSRFVLGGFSQGSMLATDVALRLPKSVAALIVWSGTLLSEDDWRTLAPSRSGLRVLQSHGTFDPLLPYEAATALRELLTQSGLDVEFLSFQGMHTIPYEAVTGSVKLLADVLATD